MASSKVVALHGMKGSGKDTVALTLASAMTGVKVRTIAFADPIKDVINHIFELDASTTAQYDEFKRTRVSYQVQKQLRREVDGRRLVREIGMLMRSYDEQQFVRYVVDKINQSEDTVWVITDLRFANELLAMREYGATIVQVIRNGFEPDGHITERGLDYADYTINNDSTHSALTETCKELAKLLRKDWNL